MTGGERVQAAGLTLAVLAGLLVLASIFTSVHLPDPMLRPSPLYNTVFMWGVLGVAAGLLLIAVGWAIDWWRRK